jgi:hypothetical protein
VDLQTGNFSGYAWSPNTGWINLGSGLLKTDSMHITDSDNDGISDAWEIAYNNGDLNVMNETSNSDADPATDLEEYLALTIPKTRTATCASRTFPRPPRLTAPPPR